MSNQEETTIDGVRYRVRPLDPFTATDLLADLVQIFGPSLAALGVSGAKPERDPGAVAEAMQKEGIGQAGFERAVMLFTERFTKERQRQIITQLAAVTEFSTDGAKWPQLDRQMAIHFAGKTLNLYRWLGFALRSQFKDFFDLAGPAIGGVIAKMTGGQTS